MSCIDAVWYVVQEKEPFGLEESTIVHYIAVTLWVLVQFPFCLKSIILFLKNRSGRRSTNGGIITTLHEPNKRDLVLCLQIEERGGAVLFWSEEKLMFATPADIVRTLKS